MEYAGSYALFNYRLEDPEKSLEYENLRLIRAFEHGLDPASSEAGFVLVHVAMVKESGALVKGTVGILNGSAGKDRETFDEGLRTLVEGLRKVNAVMNSEFVVLHACHRAKSRSHVEPQQAKWLHELPHFHLRHHFPVDVPRWCRL
jgi:hypothetical protein